MSPPTIINKTVTVYRKQRLFLESKALWRAFCGGIGSGKSFIGALDMIRRSKSNRLYLVCAPTYTMLSDSSFRSFVDVAQRLDVLQSEDIKRSAPPSLKLRTGAEVLFRSADDPERLRGPNLSGVWLDEASLMKKEAFDILIGRLREGSEMGWGTATFTPKGKAHWTYKAFAVNAKDSEMIRASTDENAFLPKEFYTKIRAQYTAAQIKQELGGEFVDAGGNHYFPGSWPRYKDTGDAYRIKDGERWRHIRKAECTRLIALDWAMGKPKKKDVKDITKLLSEQLTGDCTAFGVADLTEDGLLLILNAVNERIPLGSNAPRLAELCRRWNPTIVAGDDDNLSVAMLLECRRYRDIPEIKCLSIGGNNKLVRCQASFIRGEHGLIYLPDTEPEWLEPYCDQLASFTGLDGEPDDMADMTGILGRLADELKPGEEFEDVMPEIGALGYQGFYGQ